MYLPVGDSRFLTWSTDSPTHHFATQKETRHLYICMEWCAGEIGYLEKAVHSMPIFQSPSAHQIPACMNCSGSSSTNLTRFMWILCNYFHPPMVIPTFLLWWIDFLDGQEPSRSRTLPPPTVYRLWSSISSPVLAFWLACDLTGNLSLPHCYGCQLHSYWVLRFT